MHSLVHVYTLGNKASTANSIQRAVVYTYNKYAWQTRVSYRILGELKHSHLRGCQVCLTEIMTSEIQKVSANKLVVNKFQLVGKC